MDIAGLQGALLVSCKGHTEQKSFKQRVRLSRLSQPTRVVLRQFMRSSTHKLYIHI